MQEPLSERSVDCPYCGERLDLLIDTSAGAQSYVEDCQVCCRPMNVSFTCRDGELDELRVSSDA